MSMQNSALAILLVLSLLFQGCAIGVIDTVSDVITGPADDDSSSDERKKKSQNY